MNPLPDTQYENPTASLKKADLDSLKILRDGLVDLQNDPLFISILDSMLKIEDSEFLILSSLDTALELQGYHLADSLKRSVKLWGNLQDTMIVGNLIDGYFTDSFRITLLYIPFGDILNLSQNTTFYSYNTLDTANPGFKVINGSLIQVSIDSGYVAANPTWMVTSRTIYELTGPYEDLALPWRRCYCTPFITTEDANGELNNSSMGTCDASHRDFNNGDACPFCGRANFKSQCSGLGCAGC